MTETSGGLRLGKGRIAVILAVVLAVIGAVLITMAVHGSRPGAPQPSAAQAGVIDGDSAASSTGTASGDSVTGSGTSAPATTSVSTNSLSSTTAKAPAPTTANKPGAPMPTASSTAAKTTSRPAAPRTTGIAPPSFSNPAKGLLLEPSLPVSLSIPALGVSSPLLTLGLNPDGTVQVPSLDDPTSKAGWYKGSPTPGSIGPAILLGHIDSKKYGPGVFYKIGSLVPGQEVDVTRQDGTVAVFTIDGVRSYPKAQFPTKDVYGNIDHAGLRLITCGGTFDPSISSYESNIVAYASLKSSHKA